MVGYVGRRPIATITNRQLARGAVDAVGGEAVGGIGAQLGPGQGFDGAHHLVQELVQLAPPRARRRGALPPASGADAGVHGGAQRAGAPRGSATGRRRTLGRGLRLRSGHDSSRHCRVYGAFYCAYAARASPDVSYA